MLTPQQRSWALNGCVSILVLLILAVTGLFISSALRKPTSQEVSAARTEAGRSKSDERWKSMNQAERDLALKAQRALKNVDTDGHVTGVTAEQAAQGNKLTVWTDLAFSDMYDFGAMSRAAVNGAPETDVVLFVDASGELLMNYAVDRK